MTKTVPGPTTLGAPFFAAMVLLMAAVVACSLGLWLSWTTVFEPVPSKHECAYETAALAILIHDANKTSYPTDMLKEALQRDGPKPAERVHGAAQRALNAANRFSSVDAYAALRELWERQEEDVRNWRLRRLFLFAVPTLAVGIGTGWLGLRLLRRLRVPGTVFAVEGDEKVTGEESANPQSRM